jgi:type VII secretion-associated protein (TIGR03931 family)
VTAVVVEVGPVTVRGPDPVPAEWEEQALTCVADRWAVVDGAIVSVSDLWRDVLSAATGERAQAVVLVLPTWWPSSWEATVTAAARAVTADVTVFRRAALLGTICDGAVVECADDVLTVALPDHPTRTVDRENVDLTQLLDGHEDVLLDVPRGVAAPVGLPDRRSRRVDIVAAIHRTVAAPAPRRHRWMVAVLSGCILTLAVAPWLLRREEPPGAVMLSEGRAAIEVPDGWTVERVTTGPGSARVRVSAPGGMPALHLTQSIATAPVDLSDVAETLRTALALEPPGVFVDFRADGSVAGRAAVTYREVRPESQTEWAIVVDGEVRIAVGCQSAYQHSVTDECVRAVRSAHAIG